MLVFFSLLLMWLITLSVVPSPDIVSTNKHPPYLTLECLMCISPMFRLFSIFLLLRIHWRFSTILKTRNKSAWSNVFSYVKIWIFWKCIQYSIHWDKTHILKKSPLDNKRYKNALFFLSPARTHHSFTFNLRFLYELKA